MAQETYRFILIPTAARPVRTFEVPARSVKRAVALGSAALVLLLGVSVHEAWLIAAASSRQRLLAENAALRAKASVYDKDKARLESRVRALQQTVTRFSLATGIEQQWPADDTLGVGGVSGREAVSPGAESFFGRMERRITKLTRRSEKLEHLYRERKELLDSTPSIWPVHGFVSAPFGNRSDPFTGEADFHSGVDISDPLGSRVAASADGTVISCGVNGGYGKNVVLDHGHDLTTRYAHLSEFSVKLGQRVRRGDVIGFVGTTGRSTGPHLHYEVWLKDHAENPLHYVIEEYKSFD